VYLELQQRLRAQLRSVLTAKYDLEPENIPIEIPPDLQFGELATPIASNWPASCAKRPKSSPKKS